MFPLQTGAQCRRDRARALVPGYLCQAGREMPQRRQRIWPSARGFSQAREPIDQLAGPPTPARRSRPGLKAPRKKTSAPWTSSPSKRRHRHCAHVFDPKTRDATRRHRFESRIEVPDQTVDHGTQCPPSRQKLFVSGLGELGRIAGTRDSASCCRRICVISPKTADAGSLARLDDRSKLDFSHARGHIPDIPRAARSASPPPGQANAIHDCGSPKFSRKTAVRLGAASRRAFFSR